MPAGTKKTLSLATTGCAEEKCAAVLKNMTARNLELRVAFEKLAAAVQNHKLNCQIATEVDYKLWADLDSLVDYND